jgi:beta-glucosidase
MREWDLGGWRWLACGLLLMLSVAPANAQPASSAAPPVYRDPNAPIDQRVEDLLGRMTLDEKIAQLTCVWTRKTELLDAAGNFDPARARALYPAGIGQFARPSDLKGGGDPYEHPFRDERQTVALVNAIQHFEAEQTRLGIPTWFHEEALHGYVARNATHFPQAIGLASTWDPPLLTHVFAIAAREARVRGIQQVLAPVVDVARDPRWGRIEETYGEDPYLVGELAVAAIHGFQGDRLPLAPDHVFATLKHLTGHGQPEGGTNVGPASISERVLREFFFPPFAAGVQRANAQFVMPSYNEIDGVPSHANTWLLTKVLRGEMGFKGAVVSDYEGIEQLATLHHVEPDLTAAAARALHAGVDFDLPDGEAYRKLPQALAAKRVTQEQIDNAVRRMLRMKFLAGLFEHPYADVQRAEAITGNAEASALALKAARESLVLLKNDGTLPFSPTKLKTLAVIGPNADAARLGGYSNVPKHTITVREGIRTLLGSSVRIVTAEGVRLVEKGDWYSDEVVPASPEDNRRRIREAVTVAREADAIVLVLGDTEATSREAWATNHLGDRSDLTLLGEQDELARAMFELKKPVVVVLENGRPLSVVELSEKANAIIEAWYPGQEGGTAVAEALLGQVNPGGKLPVTVPRSVGQLPLTYNEKPSAHRGYLFGTTAPLFPFGFGLSYTKFEIGPPVLQAPKVSAAKLSGASAGTVTVSVPVRNTGKVAGDEVVQLYVHENVSSVTRPVKELKGFHRVTLAPGEATTVRFALSSDAFAIWNEYMRHVIEPGRFDILVGPDSVNLKSAPLTITP